MEFSVSDKKCVEVKCQQGDSPGTVVHICGLVVSAAEFNRRGPTSVPQRAQQNIS